MLLDPVKLMPPELVPYAQDIDDFKAATRVRLLWPPIGIGGGGTVVAAQDARGADLAIKIVLADTDAMRDQVKREANILKQVQHAAALSGQGVLWQKHFPHVDLFFLAMELVEGQTLAACLDANGTLDEATALEWTIAIAEGLEAMHRQKIIHRDIKPENIILAQSGRRYQPILVDYGIAKVGNHTARGAKAATDGYAPPEQYRGGTDQRSDIYALGATLFEMITGRTPPKATKRDVKTVLEPRQFNARISVELEVVIQIATACAPDQRFHTMGALLDALRLVESKDSAALYTILQTLGLVKKTSNQAQPVSVSGAISAPQLPPLPMKQAALKVISPPAASPDPAVLSLAAVAIFCPNCGKGHPHGVFVCDDCGALVSGVNVPPLTPQKQPRPVQSAVTVAGVSSAGMAVGSRIIQYPDSNVGFHLLEVLAGGPITLGPLVVGRRGRALLGFLYICWFGFGLLGAGSVWWAITGNFMSFNLIFSVMVLWTCYFLWRASHLSLVQRQGHRGIFERAVLLVFGLLILFTLIGLFFFVLFPFTSWPISRAWTDALAGFATSFVAYGCIKVWLS